MGSRLILINIIIALSVFCIQVRCIVRANATNASSHEYHTEGSSVPEILDLFKCPGSNIDLNRLYNISGLYFGEGDFEEDSDGGSRTLARFTEGAPVCSLNSLPLTSTTNLQANESAGGHFLYRHGWLLKQFDETLSESIPPNRYCISELGTENFTVKYCKSNCHAESCISKCCFADQVYGIDEDEDIKCSDSGSVHWTSAVNNISETKYSFLHHPVDCDNDYFHIVLHSESKNANLSSRNHFNWDEKGAVQFYHPVNGNWITLPKGTYCIDGAVSYSPEGEVIPFSGDTSDTVLYACPIDLQKQPEPVEEEKKRDFDFVLYKILVPLATVFIVLTLVVYILTWSEQNVHGYTIFFYLVTLLALYFFIVLGYIPSIANPDAHPICCGFIAGAIHFSYLSCTCWLTVVSFDVFRTFQKMHGVTRRSKGLRRFTLYSIFSVGYPIAQVTVCAILDVLYRGTPSSDIILALPNYGHGGRFCSLSNEGITFYLYTPISILLACNVIFFLATVAIMKHHKKSIREAFSKIHCSSSARANKSCIKFGIYARLFIIMGIFWITQIIGWFAVDDTSPKSSSLEVIFAISDTLTVLQAVVIFYIFVCKKNVFVNLWNLQPWLRPFLSLWITGGCCALPPTNGVKVPSRPNSGLHINNTTSTFAGSSCAISTPNSRKGSGLSEQRGSQLDSPSFESANFSRKISHVSNGSSMSNDSAVSDMTTSTVASRTSKDEKMEVIDETEESKV